MTDLHPLDLMNMVPADGDIPREIVVLARGCFCRGDEHDPDSDYCPMGQPVGVDVEAYRNVRALNAELVAALTAIADEAVTGDDAVRAADRVLFRLGLRPRPQT